MASNIKTTTLFGGFEAIDGLEFRKAIAEKGHDMVQHIFNVKEVRKFSDDGQVLEISISGQCIREMSLSKDPWNVIFELTSDRHVILARCSCTAGIDGMCKHTAALFKFVNLERSEGCTDDKQGWSKPTKKLNDLYPKGESIQKLFFQKSPEKRDFSGTSFDHDRVIKLMEKHSLQNCSVYKTLTAKAPEQENVPEIEVVLNANLEKMLLEPVSRSSINPHLEVSLSCHFCNMFCIF